MTADSRAQKLDSRGITSRGGKEKAAYGLGAAGKDMAYMLSSGYVLYYYQDILGVSAVAMGVILMAARVFDAFNDPVMGMLVARTRTKWGRFRPWLIAGTLLNALMLTLLFSAPPALDGKGLAAYAAAVYILWGVTYTMMDIPFWSMIPAFTRSGKERESLASLARTCSAAGAAIVTMTVMQGVRLLGNGNERKGFALFALITSAAYALCCSACMILKERPSENLSPPTVRQMFSALIKNDQAMTAAAAIVLVNCSLYITSGLAIYYFKYDMGGNDWHGRYTLFCTLGGGVQILSMALFFPLMRKFFSAVKLFYLSISAAAAGYGLLLALMFSRTKSLPLLMLPAFLIFAAFGIITVLTTVFLANSVDYGEYKTGRRDESVIFSMQTLVIKLASGAAAFIASVSLAAAGISGSAESPAETYLSGAPAAILRLTMTALPAAGILTAAFIFKRKFILDDKTAEEISRKLKS